MQLSLIELEVPVKSYLHFKISAKPALRFHATPALRVFDSLMRHCSNSLWTFPKIFSGIVGNYCIFSEPLGSWKSIVPERNASFSLPRRCGVAWRCVFTHELQCNVGVASLNATPTSKIVFLHAILMKFSLVISKDIFRDVREELYLFRPVGFVKIHCSWEKCQLFLESGTMFCVALRRRCAALRRNDLT